MESDNTDYCRGCGLDLESEEKVHIKKDCLDRWETSMLEYLQSEVQVLLRPYDLPDHYLAELRLALVNSVETLEYIWAMRLKL